MKKSRITETFKKLSARNGKAFIPYIMCGDPDLEKTAERVLLLERCGADIIELGVPFSDPLADGPTIQRAAERAIGAGVTLKKVIAFVGALREKTRVPIVLMTYYNPVFKYGEGRFVTDAVEAGVDGVIIPDLPPDEAAGLIRSARAAGLDTIFLAAPTSSGARIKKTVSVSRGFVYYVSMTAITGARLVLDEKFTGHISKVREAAGKPVAVGFGVSTPEDARLMAGVADGVIIGSAIVKKFHEDPGGAEAYIKELREAI